MVVVDVDVYLERCGVTQMEERHAANTLVSARLLRSGSFIIRPGVLSSNSNTSDPAPALIPFIVKLVFPVLASLAGIAMVVSSFAGCPINVSGMVTMKKVLTLCRQTVLDGMITLAV